MAAIRTAREGNGNHYLSDACYSTYTNSHVKALIIVTIIYLPLRLAGDQVYCHGYTTQIDT